MFPLIEFDESATVWEIFGGSWSRGTHYQVQETCRSLYLPYVRVLDEEACPKDFCGIELTTNPAGYTFRSAYREIEEVFQQYHISPIRLTDDRIELCSERSLIGLVVPYLFRILLFQRPQGSSTATLISLAARLRRNRG